MAPTRSSRCLAVAFTLCFFQAVSGLALPTSTTTSTPTSSQWTRVLEAARFIVSRWLNETTAIIAIGAIVGLAAASFAVFGFEWKDYGHGPPERLANDEGESGVLESTKPTMV